MIILAACSIIVLTTGCSRGRTCVYIKMLHTAPLTGKYCRPRRSSSQRCVWQGRLLHHCWMLVGWNAAERKRSILSFQQHAFIQLYFHFNTQHLQLIFCASKAKLLTCNKCFLGFSLCLLGVSLWSRTQSDGRGSAAAEKGRMTFLLEQKRLILSDCDGKSMTTPHCS